MSTTDTKRPWVRALADAEALRALIPSTAYRRWEIAGSVRRGAERVGDVEHVIEPVFGEVEVAGVGLFAERRTVNLLWHHVDRLERELVIMRHVYPHGTNRWGEKYRGLSWRGFAHEFFTADADNWGSVLLIRTGPADFSQEYVTRLRDAGTPSRDGYVRDAQGNVIPVRNEEAAFALVRAEYVPPARRVGWESFKRAEVRL